MGISVQWMLDNIAKKRLAGSGPRFEAVFVDAINQVIADINTQCNLEIDDIASTSDTVDLESQKYSRAFMHGIPYYMQLFAEWTKDPPDMMKFIYDRALAMCQFHSITDEDGDVGFPEY